MNCTSCNSSISEHAKFCKNCGHGVNAHSEVEIIQKNSKVSFNNLEAKALKEWNEFAFITKLYLFFFGLSVITSFAYRIKETPIVELYYWGIFIITSFFVGLKQKKSIFKFFKFKPFDKSTFIKFILFSLVTVIFLKLYFWCFEFLPIKRELYSEDYIKVGWPIWSQYVLVAVMPAIFEEFIFRGIIYTKLKELLGVKESLIIQAACFSVLHLYPTIFISHFVMGFYFGWIREKTNSLYLCIIAHFLWNAHVLYLEFI